MFNLIARPLLLCLLLLGASRSFAQEQPERYSRVRIDLSPRGTMVKLIMTGVLDHALREKDALTAEFSESELRTLRDAGIPYTVLIDDAAAHYEAAARADKGNPVQHGAGQTSRLQSTPTHFHLGSMGGFMTLAEVVRQLDSMQTLYPALVTPKTSIGTTIEGRPMWMMKFGSASSAGKPQVLYTSLHHAREPGGMMTLMYYMWWLLENYQTNPEAKYILDHRELYFIPVVNPDGFEYNRTTNPNGGGLWRKNRRINSATSVGVDLNRNYGTLQFWDAPNGGSSTAPSSDTYRGTAPFSEPETQAIRTFCTAKNFRAALNYHTYSQLLIYPFGYSSGETADSLIYRRFGADMTAVNQYTYGLDQETVGYSTRGNSDDWMYGEASTKPKIFAMTPEVSTSFWATPSQITPDCAINLEANKYLAQIAGAYLSASKQADNPFVPIGSAVPLLVRFSNKGLEGSAGNAVQLVSADGDVQLLQSSFTLGALASQQDTLLSAFTVQLSPSTTPGKTLAFTLRIEQAPGVFIEQPVTAIAGTPIVRAADNADSAARWTSAGTGGVWVRTAAQAFSPAYSWTDSPTGNYAANVNTTVTLNDTIDLSDTAITNVYLDYRARWQRIEPNYDWAQLSLSTNNGATWTPVRAPGMSAGVAGGVQQPSQYGYEGTQLEWIRETVDVSAAKGSAQCRVRFSLRADGAVEGDGFYFDDFQVLVIRNAALPVTLTSFEGKVGSGGVQLKWTTASEQNNFGFEVERSRDNRLYTKLAFVPGNGTTAAATDYAFTDGNLSGTVFYRLKQIDLDGNFSYSQTIEVKAGRIDGYRLLQNYPNPFNPQTTIGYELPAESEVSLKLYDALGRQVATLVQGRQAFGRYEVSVEASRLAAGVYFYRLQSGSFVETKKMLLVK